MPGTRISIPVDLHDIDDLTADDRVRVVARTRDGTIVSTDAAAADLSDAPVELELPDDPGRVTIVVGPIDADPELLLEAETPGITIPAHRWREDLSIEPIRIGPWHWGRWRRWCRTIVVRGRLVCPDGSPVPGAEVCAYDVDWWFIWSSMQQVGCTTTAADGTFSMKFTWCCGLYPWWWWFRTRPWQFDPELADLVRTRVGDAVDLPLRPPTPQPSLSVVSDLLTQRDLAGREATTALSDLDPEALEALRPKLLERLPAAPELAKLSIWPWVPWRPWTDCTPDLVFRATQDCGNGAVVVLDEGTNDVRLNVEDKVSVTLVATDEACCRPRGGEQDCLIVDRFCNVPAHHVAGNDGAPATPAAVTGYRVTGTDHVDNNLDQPFAGDVEIWHAPSDLDGLDYYGFEHSTNGGGTWSPLPAGAARPFPRHWMEFSPLDVGSEMFTLTTVGPFEIYETRRHFEDTNYGDWAPGGDRFWLSKNHDKLLELDSTVLSDTVHHVRVVGFAESGPGQFEGPEPVIGCDDEQAGFVLRIDNRVVTDLGHDPSHNCGDGVHLCTVEPDTAIIQVRVNGEIVGPCDTIEAGGSGTVEIDFLAVDPDDHLGSIHLATHWGVSQQEVLTNTGTLVSLDGGPDAWNYSQALALGAVRPNWGGGRFRLTVPVAVAFPEPCSYLLRLRADKRNILSCNQVMRNWSEMTLAVI